LLLAAVFCALFSLFLTGCGTLSRTPCDGLIYDEAGPVKEKYLPCAGAILDTMSRLDQRLQRVAMGDKDARPDALREMADLRILVGRAGGVAKLSGAWANAQLREVNRGICGAYEVYDLEVNDATMPTENLPETISRQKIAAARAKAEEARRWYRIAQ
jgi:hypothetical protein